MFISAALQQWAQCHGGELLHIPSGEPTHNACFKRFSWTCRNEFLDRYGITSPYEVRCMT